MPSVEVMSNDHIPEIEAEYFKDMKEKIEKLYEDVGSSVEVMKEECQSLKEIRMSKNLGMSIAAMANIPCPRCAEDEPMLEQNLAAFGDFENRLFCPHCEMEVSLISML